MAQANVEAMIDGLVAPSAERLEAVADSLRRARRLLQESDDG